jgi:hypothetical protein
MPATRYFAISITISPALEQSQYFPRGFPGHHPRLLVFSQ